MHSCEQAGLRNSRRFLTYVQTLLRLRRENDALRDGKLWHLAADDSSYIFFRESDEEKLVIAFSDGANSKTVNLSLQGTPAEAAAGISTIFGNGRGRSGRAAA